MRRLLLFALLFMLLPVAYSQPALIVNQSLINSEPLVGLKNQVNFHILNNGSQEMLNLTFEVDNDRALFRFPILQNITVNTTVPLNITYEPNGIFSRSYVLKLLFYYLTDITLQPEQHIINITDAGYLPATLAIKDGDTVVFINYGLVNHSVTHYGGSLFNAVVPPQANFSHTFAGQGAYQYYSENDLPIANIQVGSNIGKIPTHDAALDKLVVFNVNTKYPQGIAYANLLHPNISIDFLEQQEGVVDIINNLTFPLYNIEFEVDVAHRTWLNFTESNFTIQPNSNKVVTFKVRHNLTTTSATNQTYLIPFKIKPANAPAIDKEVSVYVKYHDFGNIQLNNTCISITELSIEETIATCLAKPDYPNCERLLLFCLEYPDYGKCKDLYPVIIVKEKEAVTVSGEQVEKMWAGFADLNNILTRWDNNKNVIESDVAAINQNTGALKQQFDAMVQERANEIVKQKEKAKKDTLMKVLKVTGLILIGLIISIWLLIRFLGHKGAEIEEIRLPPSN